MTATLATSDPILTAFAEEVGSSDPIAVEGKRTRWELGGPLTDGTRIVSAPSGIVQYAPEEMTITIRAGTTVTDLNLAMAAEGQRTALPERGGTVGGALAVAENDIRALGRGLLRSSVLQVRYISAEGRLISSGGPTVKNVTGFDLPRLMVGSLGTLGLLAEVILRTNPIPPISRWLRSDDADPAATYNTLLAPSAVLWDGLSTWVELEGHYEDVVAQQQSLAPIGAFREVEDAPHLPASRWSVPPAELLTPPAGIGDFVAVIGLGLLFADQPQPERTVSPEVAVISERLKANFDPLGRLNPGRVVGRN